VESGQEAAATARLNQDQAGRTSGERLCPDDMFEHPPTMTGFVNVSRKKISEIAKVPSCGGTTRVSVEKASLSS